MPPSGEREPRPTADALASGPRLADLERQFFSLITAPEGVAAGLGAQGRTAAELAAVIAGDERASAVDRLDIYANMYFYRIRDTLRDYFPATAAVLDEHGFHNLITDYLLAHPSRHPSLREVGRQLPGFIVGHALAAGRPWLGELAALEWARLDVFDRRDQVALAHADLAALAPGAFAALALPLLDALMLVPTAYAIDGLWTAVQEARPPSPEPPPGRLEAGAFVVWRRGITVYHRFAARAEAEALGWLCAGLRFGELCERLAARASPEDAARQASAWLGTWLADGLLAAA